jgi:hypothetical protein
VDVGGHRPPTTSDEAAYGVSRLKNALDGSPECEAEK